MHCRHDDYPDAGSSSPNRLPRHGAAAVVPFVRLVLCRHPADAGTVPPIRCYPPSLQGVRRDHGQSKP